MNPRIKLSMALAAVSVIGCSAPPQLPPAAAAPAVSDVRQLKPDAYGSITSYAALKGEGGGNEMEYCFHYSKRIWELGSLIQSGRLSQQAAQERTHKSLGKLGAEEDDADIGKLISDEYKTAEEMAGNRFYRCGKTLRLPVEERHLAISASCFSLLKLPRYVADQRSRGRSLEQTRYALRQANNSVSLGLIDSVVSDVYASHSTDAINTLFRELFLSCLVAGGSPGVR